MTTVITEPLKDRINNINRYYNCSFEWQDIRNAITGTRAGAETMHLLILNKTDNTFQLYELTDFRKKRSAIHSEYTEMKENGENVSLYFLYYDKRTKRNIYGSLRSVNEKNFFDLNFNSGEKFYSKNYRYYKDYK